MSEGQGDTGNGGNIIGLQQTGVKEWVGRLCFYGIYAVNRDNRSSIRRQRQMWIRVRPQSVQEKARTSSRFRGQG